MSKLGFRMRSVHYHKMLIKQGVAVTGRNTTDPPWSVARPPASSVTDDGIRQLAKQYCPLHYV